MSSFKETLKDHFFKESFSSNLSLEILSQVQKSESSAEKLDPHSKVFLSINILLKKITHLITLKYQQNKEWKHFCY